MTISTYDPTRERSVLRCKERPAKLVRTNASGTRMVVGVLFEESATVHHSLQIPVAEAEKLVDELSRRIAFIRGR